MSHLIHRPEPPVQTEGRLLRGASYYDLLVNLISLGQVSRLRGLTVALAQVEPGDSVLDVGCGPGSVTIPAKIRTGVNGQAAGIDPSPEMIAVARRKAAKKGLDIDFRVGVIEALPFPEASFDVVTSSLMFHHLPGKLQVRGLSETYRVLKPGGRILIADFMPSKTTFLGRMILALSMHRGTKFGMENLPALLRDSQFTQVSLLKERFLVVGFIRATK